MEQSNQSASNSEILSSYIHIAEATAEFWGECCEVVVHNLANLDHSVMFIVNGHLSSRQVGAAISDVTLSFLNRMISEPDLHHLYYFAKNNNGETFKASMCAIYGENKTIIGLFCMNLYLSTPISSFMHCMMPEGSGKQESLSETFVDDTKELMLNALEDAKKAVYTNLSILPSNRNKEIVSILHHKGIFNLKDSVITIAEHLGISKNTVYMHIRNLK